MSWRRQASFAFFQKAISGLSPSQGGKLQTPASESTEDLPGWEGDLEISARGFVSASVKIEGVGAPLGT